ncbi:hypothetical protein [Geopsychrobacter electrodiphilus]|uniref:hypothetical protein n=1 Tax=Geopsychrobacter electrodiphilus TaxID=225196 RepID=UPI00037986BD|nr:hypothetical protein [Geopsychrobacter electrodiphilus]
MNQKTTYVEKLSAEMVAWEVHIERLKEKAETASPEKKFEHYKTISALQFKRDEAAKKLQGISLASDHEWEEFKSGTERIRSEMGNLLSAAIKNT